ncbi:hypothetical protein PYCCODRAFT_1420777 [Trametes coccinea BRFM310]|uniref:Uncharacterized protein n=1 Tax=Trametes coccinea (strain BRFM310) TaxID=1353009 RepID=A0A1Y2I657_TRAC3|nr:hypothetical protein PYCCODRAFT_1420777 [Trametes coccinea BRFM310]
MATTGPKRRVFFSPSPGTYAVMRFNPVETVHPFEDPQALTEAQAMRLKSHLIMLDIEMALPFPNKPWYRFEVQSIAPCLRTPVPEEGLTSDMYIPIIPDTAHPNGRAPVQPDPAGRFPYSNCYHWFKPVEKIVCIRAWPEAFDETDAVFLSPASRVDMDFTCWYEDAWKINAKKFARKAAENVAAGRAPEHNNPAPPDLTEPYDLGPLDDHSVSVVDLDDGSQYMYPFNGSLESIDEYTAASAN